MTVPAVSRIAGPFLGNGVTTIWPFTFQVNSATELVARVFTAAGVSSDLVLNSTFTVTLNPDQQASPGGSITIAVPVITGSTLYIIGNVALSQPLDLPSGGPFSAVSIENQLDRMVMQIQQLRDQLGTTIEGPLGETVNTLPAAAVRRGGYLGFDSASGQPVILTPVPTNISATGNILPDTTLIRNLGSSGQRWANVFTNTLDASGAVTLSSTLAVTGNATVGGTLAVTGNVSGRVAGNGLIGFGVALNTPSANQATITLQPCVLDFRSATVTDGAITQVVVANPITLVLPAGASIGASNGVANRYWLLALNNAGTVELAIYGQPGGPLANENGAANTTAISAGSTDGSTIYSAVARTGVTTRVIGHFDATLTTAGQWTGAITRAVNAGGQFAKFSQMLGSPEQSWQNVTGSRAKATSYSNTTGRPIMVYLTCTSTAANDKFQWQINGSTYGESSTAPVSGSSCVAVFVAPPGVSYAFFNLTGNPTLSTWSELR